jgi:butyryl-CoA dehydrogenase
MNFKITDTQQMVRDSIREFAETEVAPTAAARDESEEFPSEAVQKLGELGFMGVNVAEEYGGSGLDNVSYAIAVEELARVDASTAIIVSVQNSLVCFPLEYFGTAEQKKKYLIPLASGKKLGAFSLSETGSGSDAGAMTTTAVKDGDYYIINGNKNFVTSGANCDYVIVFAVTDQSMGTRGTSAFIVDVNTPGFSVGKKELKMGIRSSDTVSLILENCRIPASDLLGTEGGGFKIALTALNSGRIGVASQALGIAQGAMDEAVKYSKVRQQFGKRIIDFQATQFKIARMATDIEAARWLLYSAADRKDRKENYIKEAAMAKLFCSETAVRTALEAVQIHGGYGYIKEYPVERYLRDSKITTIYEGTNEVMHLVISGQIIGKGK